MVVMKNSEYRRHFVPKFDTHLPTYSQNVGYRSARRSAEFAHNRDVFTWEPESWEKQSCTSVLQEEPRPGVNPSNKYKHAVYNKDYQERVLSQCIQEQCHLDGPNNNAQKGEEPKTPPPSPANEKEESAQVKEIPTAVKSNENASSKRPKKPTQSNNGPNIVSKKTGVRPKSCQAGPAASAKAVNLKPPFIMFSAKGGRKDAAMSDKKTYNVKSSVDVHPSAVRASQWRQEQQLKRQKSAPPTSARSRPKLFDVVMDKETSCWQTEYGGHFVQYKPKIYERNSVSRMSVPHCTDIQVSKPR